MVHRDLFLPSAIMLHHFSSTLRSSQLITRSPQLTPPAASISTTSCAHRCSQLNLLHTGDLFPLTQRPISMTDVQQLAAAIDTASFLHPVPTLLRRWETTDKRQCPCVRQCPSLYRVSMS